MNMPCPLSTVVSRFERVHATQHPGMLPHKRSDFLPELGEVSFVDVFKVRDGQRD